MTTDTTPPTIAITSDKTTLKPGETSRITFTLSGPSSFRVEPNIQNRWSSSSPVGMWAGRLPACPHVHGAGLARGCHERWR
jgi:hypothetical protein